MAMNNDEKMRITIGAMRVDNSVETRFSLAFFGDVTHKEF